MCALHVSIFFSSYTNQIVTHTMAHFETLFTPLVPPKVAPANALEWSNCGLKRIPKDSEQLRLNCESLNVSLLFLCKNIQLNHSMYMICFKSFRREKIASCTCTFGWSAWQTWCRWTCPATILRVCRSQFLVCRGCSILISATTSFAAPTAISRHGSIPSALSSWTITCWSTSPPGGCRHPKWHSSLSISTLSSPKMKIFSMQSIFKLFCFIDDFFGIEGRGSKCLAPWTPIFQTKAVSKFFTWVTAVSPNCQCGCKPSVIRLKFISAIYSKKVGNFFLIYFIITLIFLDSLLNEICYLRQLATRSHFSSNTQVLNLANISLGSLPEDIDHLGSLRVFLLQKNKLSFLPNSFGRLTNLEFCDLSQCKLTDLPQNFGDLVNLKSLILHGNKVSFFIL